MAAEKKADKNAAQQRTGDDRKRALEVALSKIEKDFGKGSVMKLGDAAEKMNVEVISTGCLQLDMALGVGGLPRGRIIEIYGPESSGKTTVALHIVAQAQKAGGIAAFVDAEHALDPAYAKKLGVNIDGSTLYCTHQPCILCAKMIVNAGIVRVVYHSGYPDEFALDIFKEAGVLVERYSESEE